MGRDPARGWVRLSVLTARGTRVPILAAEGIPPPGFATSWQLPPSAPNPFFLATAPLPAGWAVNAAASWRGRRSSWEGFGCHAGAQPCLGARSELLTSAT